VLPDGPVHASRRAFIHIVLWLKLQRPEAIDALPYAETERKDHHPGRDKVIFVSNGDPPPEEGDDG
jgi:hypothetical protein